MNTTLTTDRASGALLPGIADTSDRAVPRTHDPIDDSTIPPVSLDAFGSLDPKTADTIRSFQQWCLENDISIAKAASLTNLSTTTISRTFRGTYEGNYKAVAEKIASYQSLDASRAGLQREVFTPTPVTRLIFAALDYALAQSTMVTVEGESRMGKTASAQAWRQGPHMGRSVFITAPIFGGKVALLQSLSRACGLRVKRPTQSLLVEALRKTLNPHRLVIVDEAHRLLPGKDADPNFCPLEAVRDLKDHCGCGVALLSTERFSDVISTRYMFEQVIGRISLPVVLPEELTEADILPIMEQFFAPSEAARAAAIQIANSPGRLGILVERMKVAQTIARDAKQRCTSEHFIKALRFVREMTTHRRPRK